MDPVLPGASLPGSVAPTWRRRLSAELRPRARELRRGAHAFRKSPVAVAGLLLIASFVGMAMLAPVLAPAAPGAADPLEMSLNFAESWCPSAPSYQQHWAWTVDGASPSGHYYEFTLVLPPIASDTRARDASFEVLVLNGTGAPLPGPPARGSRTPGPSVPVDWFVNDTLRASTVSRPTLAQRFTLAFDAPGNWTVRAVESRGAYAATAIWHVVVPDATAAHPLQRIPFTKIVFRPTTAEVSFQVHTAKDCSGLLVDPNLGAQVPVVWTAGGEALPEERALTFSGAVPIDVPLEAAYHRPISQLGTTVNGMDIYYGVVWGSQVSMRIGIEVVGFSLVIGILLGLFAGYYGGWIDEMLMRVTDVFFGIPSLILAMVVIVSIGPSLDNLVLALVAVSWPSYSRLIRGVTLTVKNNLYVEAARAAGTRAGTILRRHIFPNTVSPMMVQGSLDIGSVVLVAAGLSFIGFSFATPQTAEWGRMVYDGQQQFGASSFSVWWPVFYPGLFIFLFVLGFNMLGDGLRDVLDPRLRR